MESHAALLGTELTGDLLCARCRYNLRGLSVRGLCPECATPVAATLLTVIDPQAAELQAIRRPVLTAMGLVAWSLGGLAAALAMWVVRVGDAAPAVQPGPWAAWTVAACLLCSAAGGLALVSPHAGIRRMYVVSSLVAVTATVALAWTAWTLVATIDGPRGRPYLMGSEWSPRWAWSLGSSALVGVIVLGYRPVFHILQARSYLLRTGQVERQTLRALAASAAVMLCGDLGQVALRGLHVESETVLMIPMFLTGVGALLLTAGLIGIVIDVMRLLRVVLTPPLGLTDVLRAAPPDGGRAGAEGTVTGPVP
ncbi:MAG: hypothetical protein AMXMBFR58_14440 [Phycisphaerae bacterium]